MEMEWLAVPTEPVPAEAVVAAKQRLTWAKMAHRRLGSPCPIRRRATLVLDRHQGDPNMGRFALLHMVGELHGMLFPAAPDVVVAREHVLSLPRSAFQADFQVGGDAADDVRPMTPPCVNAMLLVCSVFDLVLTQLRSAYPAAGD